MIKYTWNMDGFHELRKAPQTQQLVRDAAKQIADYANSQIPNNVGKGFVVSARPRKMRYGAIIYTGDFRVAHYNKKDNVLKSAMINVSESVE